MLNMLSLFSGIGAFERALENLGIAYNLVGYGDYGKALMAYNMGDYGAQKAWESGVTNTNYSSTILELMQEYEEVSHNAKHDGA